jgi:signal peptidase II
MRAKYLKLAIVATVVVVLDQLSKALVLQHMPLNTTLPVIEGFFNLTHIHNPGGAFGFMADLGPGLRSFMFLFVSLLAAGLILYFYFTTPPAHSLLATGFAMIFGGAIGNLVDRVRFGKVVDFLDFHVGGWHWPAFNVADSAITTGVFIFLYHIVFKRLPNG